MPPEALSLGARAGLRAHPVLTLSHLRLDLLWVVEKESGAGRPWNFPSLDFLILSCLLCLCSWRWGEGTGLSRPPGSAGDKLLSSGGCFASFLSF